MPVSVEPADRTNGVVCWGIVQSCVNVRLPERIRLALFIPVSESSGTVAVAPPANFGGVATFCTRYVPANCTGQLNVTSAPESVTTFVTVSAPVPPTVSAEPFSNTIVSPEPGAAAGVAPSTRQLPGVDQSPPLAPFHT